MGSAFSGKSIPGKNLAKGGVDTLGKIVGGVAF